MTQHLRSLTQAVTSFAAALFCLSTLKADQTATATIGNTVTIAVYADGTEPYTYQWNKAGTDIVGATAGALVLANAQITDSGDYSVKVANALGSTLSDVAHLTVGSPAAITTQPSPASQTVAAGASTVVTYSVVATGMPSLTYQWKKNGINLTNAGVYSGVTTDTLTITGALVAQTGNYTVVANSGIGNAATSTAASLTVTKGTPVITTAPTASTITYGQSLAASSLSGGAASVLGTFAFSSPTTVPNAGAGQTVAITFQPTDTVNYQTATGTTTITVLPLNQTITFAALPAKTYGDPPFALTGTASSGLTVSFASSDPSVVTVAGNVATVVGGGSSLITASQGGDINYNAAASVSRTQTVNKAAQSITFGAIANRTFGDPTFTLSATASSGLPITFANSNTAAAALSGNTVTLVAPGNTTITAQQSGNTNFLAATSVSQPLIIAGAAPSFTTQPTSVTIAPTVNTSLHAVAVGNPAPTYQWQVSTDSGATWTSLVTGGNYSGVTTDTLQISNAPVGFNAQAYRCVASNGIAPNAISAVATLTVNANAPSITAQPANQSVLIGSEAVFSVSASGIPAPTFQWQVSSDAGAHWTNLTNSGGFSGVTSATLTIAAAAADLDHNEFRCITTNVLASVVSDAATLSVTGNAPTFDQQPTDVTVRDAGWTSFTAVAGGAPAPVTGWQVSYDHGATWAYVPFNSPFFGQSSSTLVITPTPLTLDGTQYRAIAVNGVGTTFSNVARLTVTAAATAPVITTQPSDATAVTGDTVTFTVVATGSPLPSYQWLKNNQAIAGATNATLSLLSVQTADAGNYTVVVTNPNGSATSLPAKLTVQSASFTGAYFGTITDSGTWALYVRSNNTGEFIGYLNDRKTAIVAPVTIDQQGRFLASGVESTASLASTTGSSGSTTGAITPTVPSTYNLQVRIQSGQLSGQIGGLGKNLSGTADVSTGPALALAGYYSAPALGTVSATLDTIVGPSGRSLAVILGEANLDAASVTVDPRAASAGTTSGGGAITTLFGANRSVSATYTQPAGAPLAFLGIADGISNTTRLANLSVRAETGPGDAMLIAGFAVSGNGSESILARGIGPALKRWGITSFVVDPVLGVYRDNTLIAYNDDWGRDNPAQVAATAAAVGAFALDDGSRDAALTGSFGAGAYSVHVESESQAPGTALIELYEVQGSSNARLTNISGRARIANSNDVLIAGFVIEGNMPRQILARAVGPSLSAFGVTGTLADPQLKIVPSTSSTPLGANNDWGGTPDLQAVFNAVGAFELPTNSKDAALLIELAPGAYSVVVSGVNGATGICLVELYDVK